MTEADQDRLQTVELLRHRLIWPWVAQPVPLLAELQLFVDLRVMLQASAYYDVQHHGFVVSNCPGELNVAISSSASCGRRKLHGKQQETSIARNPCPELVCG
jgi:hypothetical protein